jgi:hypothetical protein
MLIGHLERLGNHVTRPYHSGLEAHHFVFTTDPTPVPRHWKRLRRRPGQGDRTEAAEETRRQGAPRKGADPKNLSPARAVFISKFEGFRAKHVRRLPRQAVQRSLWGKETRFGRDGGAGGDGRSGSDCASC